MKLRQEDDHKIKAILGYIDLGQPGLKYETA